MYLSWDEQTITDFSKEHIDAMYDKGYVFGRPAEGEMKQTRNLRINLSKFELSSENRRILRKTEGLTLTAHSLPYEEYSWEIGKLGKDFYTTKFGDGTFSANKVRELLTGDRKDFNTLLSYSYPELDSGSQELNNEIAASPAAPRNDSAIGYAICVETPTLLHYSYPFYNLEADKNTGMGMMIRAINYAKESGKEFIYLGSAQRPGDVYKFQFSGLEWFDGERWNNDIAPLKQLLFSP